MVHLEHRCKPEGRNMRWFMLRNISTMALVLSAVAALSSSAAGGGTIYVTNANSGTIGEYTTSGAVVNASLISGLNGPSDIVVSGSDLFVTNTASGTNGTIGEYTTLGAVVNASLVTGLYQPQGLALSGTDLFVGNYGNGSGSIGEYTTSGATVNPALISSNGPYFGLAVSGADLFCANPGSGSISEFTTSGAGVQSPLIHGFAATRIIVSGSDLFVTNIVNGTIGEYTTSGAVVNASLVTGLSSPNGLALFGSDLFVVNAGNGTIGEYTTSGAVVNASLVTGLSSPCGILITSAPVSGAWSNGSGGNWSASGNWSGGNVPGFSGYASDTATFGTAATSGTSVTVTLDTSPLVGAITFSSTSSYVLQGSGTNVLTLSASSGAALVTVSAGSQTIAAPLMLASSVNFAPASGTQLTISGAIGGTGALSLTAAGMLLLSGTNSYSGGTTVSAGTLQGTTASLQGSITNNATLVFNQATDGAYAGTISGSGGFAKSGPGGLTLSGADTLSSTGSIAITQGTLTAPLGIPHGGGGIALAAGATLQAGGQINRAVTGAGTVTATSELIIGNATQSGQFNQGGGPGVGGTLNVGGNAVVILSSDTAILGSQTNIGNGGSLTALNGAQLGNPSSVDSTKILTATGNAEINANFVNNGVVNGPTGGGQELTFNQAVTGAGSTTGNVEYAASYRPSNSPDAVSVQNVLLDPTSTLIMELAGLLPGSGYDQLDISGLAALNGELDIELMNDFMPSVGNSFDILNGATTGAFSQINLPALNDGLQWNTSNLYANGTISVTPEPSTLALLAAGALGLLGRGLQRRRAAKRP
jgi:autotransporter-associated beta strand protein